MGYLSIPEWINSNMNGSDGLVYSIIYNHCKSHEYCDLSTQKMAEYTGKSTRTIKRSLKILEENGAIKRIGYNQYRNVKYIPLLDEENIADWSFRKVTKCQKINEQSDKVTKCQSAKMSPSKCQNVTMQSAKMSPYKNISLNKAYINIYSAKSKGDDTLTYKWYDEDSYEKFDGWWKCFIFFENDEELNDLFIKIMDKTAQENDNYNNGCRILYDLVDNARMRLKYTDEQLMSMSEEELEQLTEEDEKPIDQTRKLKEHMRNFIYNGDKKPFMDFIGM